MGARIAVVGSNMVDLITYTDRLPAAGETLAAPSFSMGHGGKGANQAVAAAKLGADVMLVTRVGDDLFGEGTLKNFRDLGIDTRHARAVPGTQSGVAPIFVEPSGENRILIVKGANEHLLPADVDAAAQDLAGCGLILLQLEIPLETIYHTIAWAAPRGIPVLLNPAPAVPELDVSRILGATFLAPNQTELSILTGLPAETREQAEAAARTLVARGVKQVIVTLGGEGALLVTADGPAQHVPAVKVKPVDTSGAGDAFLGAFAQHYAAHGDTLAAMRWGARYAADSITRQGTQKAFAGAAEFAAFRRALGEE
ncbi:ribokinase [Pseudoroseomonas cervicalis]|uniref:ribokinase n=1 Tax=Teichococcus cervicalis TaxID=204525 RepID=UPI002784DAF7|nr:ribokinase [Pseudoroseomonas cervicalis]MDQ1081922.1 ribokinase [Pseudoroseomonas cervicalis]